jgi:hypothetical protein
VRGRFPFEALKKKVMELKRRYSTHAKSSGSVTIRRRGSELSPWLFKGICGPCTGTIHTFANAGSTASLNHSRNSLGTVARTARAGGSDLTRRECAATPQIPRPNKIKEEGLSPMSHADRAHHLIAPCCFGVSLAGPRRAGRLSLTDKVSREPSGSCFRIHNA